MTERQYELTVILKLKVNAENEEEAKNLAFDNLAYDLEMIGKKAYGMKTLDDLYKLMHSVITVTLNSKLETEWKKK